MNKLYTDKAEISFTLQGLVIDFFVGDEAQVSLGMSFEFAEDLSKLLRKQLLKSTRIRE